MDKSWLDKEFDGFDPDVPIEAAWLPPSSWYTEEALYVVERRSVFRNNWLVAARTEQLRGVGDYVAGFIANEPYVVVRAQDGALRAFFNVCRHHAAAVMVGEGCTDSLVCPYHGWTYGLDGRLASAPELGRVKGFDREEFGLVPMHVREWGALVFVAMGAELPPWTADMDELQTRLVRAHWDGLEFVERRAYTVACNWKVFVDNYLDGGYHVSHLHRGLAGQLDLDTYRTEIFERLSIQSVSGGAAEPAAAGGAPATDFRERVGEGALYAWVYPNLMINRYGPMMDVNWVLPRGHDRTEVIFDYYFADTAGAAARRLIDDSLAASDVVQREDVEVCESVQRGLESSSYDRGRYSVKREMGEHHFHRLLAADLSTYKP